MNQNITPTGLLGALLLLLCFFSFSPISAQERGELVADSLYFDYDLDQIDSLYQTLGLPSVLAPIEYGVKVYRLVYWTPAPKGDSLTLASGLLFLPDGDCLWPVSSYQHGTNYYGNAPSELGSEWVLGVPFATGGYLVSMPDYVGYGATPDMIGHPYLHAETEASATIDMLRAVRNWCEDEGVGLSDQLFLGGYSQGGHATIATQRSMEQDFSEEFTITASAAGSGPYDLEGTMVNYILTDSSEADAFFIAFVVMEYQRLYGNLWDNPSEALVAPYDTILPRFFDPANPIPGPLPDTAIRMFQPAFVQAVKTDSMHPARVAMRENNLFQWSPQTPTRLSYCDADELVPFQNSIVARDSFLARGALDITAISLDPTLGHETCALPMIFNTKYWFDGLKDSCVVDSGEVNQLLAQSAWEVNVYPNPADEFLTIDLHTPSLQAVHVSLLDITGRVKMETRMAVHDRVKLNVRDLSPGTYWILIRQNENLKRLPVLIVR